MERMKVKIEDRFSQSCINKGYKFKRFNGNAFISKRGLKPRLRQNEEDALNKTFTANINQDLLDIYRQNDPSV